MDLFNNKPSPPFDVPEVDGYTVSRLEGIDGYIIHVPHGEIVYVERFFNEKISDRTVEYFQENDTIAWKSAKWKEIPAEDFAKIVFGNIRWKQDSLRMYGKSIPLPRLTAWYGDGGKTYTYSGITSQPNEWNKGLLYLKRQIEEFCGVAFNSVLLNWYRDGEDYLNWHADDEKELGTNPVIASANFGLTRDFIVRLNSDTSQKITFPLKHGTLLVMRGELQHHWQHSVPKRTKVAGSRFNMTFRRIGASTSLPPREKAP